jgi:hypothetical protein
MRQFKRFSPPAAMAPGVLCSAPLFAPLAGAVDEVQVHGVANFRGSTEGECSASSHSVHTKTANAFAATFNALKNSGKWDQVIYQHNEDIHPSRDPRPVGAPPDAVHPGLHRPFGFHAFA